MAQVLRPPVTSTDAATNEMASLTDILGSVQPSPDTAAYLAHLTSLPLADLQVEPTAVSSSSAQLTNALTTLCYTSYPTFLALHSATSTLSSSLSSLSSSLDALITSIPSLESEARTFVQETRETQADRRKASLVLEHHDKLQDVLSIPQLMDYCVRNHNYAEALLLANHAAGLAQRFAGVPLVQSVKAECDARVQAMLGQLLRMLSEQVKLPALFRAVGFLRKMDVLEEEELALAFLTGRGVYLDGVLKTVELEKGLEGGEGDKEAYARYLKRYIDAWREGVHDVVTQYTTIFLERAPSTSAATSATRLHALLTAFTTLRMNSFLALLRETLPLIPDPALLTPLLTQLTYCANSFARVGLDFKALLAPLFIDAVRKGTIKEFNTATEEWCLKLKQSSPTGKDAPRPRAGSMPTAVKKPSQLLVAHNNAPPQTPSPTQLEAIASGPANVAPPVLLAYPPLAVYTNSVLSALNSLRMLAPVALVDELLDALEAALAEGAEALLQLARERPWAGAAWGARGGGSGGSEEEEGRKEEEIVKRAGTVYIRVFVPFLRRALVEGVYGIKMGNVDRMEAALEGVVRDWEAWLEGAGGSE